jgi:hypothetical protein
MREAKLGKKNEKSPPISIRYRRKTKGMWDKKSKKVCSIQNSAYLNLVQNKKLRHGRLKC